MTPQMKPIEKRSQGVVLHTKKKLPNVSIAIGAEIRTKSLILGIEVSANPWIMGYRSSPSKHPV